MSSFDEAYEKKVLEAAPGKSPEAGRWVTLCTTAPTKSAKGTAATYTGYKDVATTAASWKTAEGGEPSKITNAAALSFPKCTGGESAVGYFEVYANEAKTERVCWGALTTSKTITSGDTPEFAAGALEVTLK